MLILPSVLCSLLTSNSEVDEESSDGWTTFFQISWMTRNSISSWFWVSLLLNLKTNLMQNEKSFIPSWFDGSVQPSIKKKHFFWLCLSEFLRRLWIDFFKKRSQKVSFQVNLIRLHTDKMQVHRKNV